MLFWWEIWNNCVCMKWNVPLTLHYSLTCSEEEHEGVIPKDKLITLCKYDPILKWMRSCDHILYQALVEVLIPDVLRPVPGKCVVKAWMAWGALTFAQISSFMFLTVSLLSHCCCVIDRNWWVAEASIVKADVERFCFLLELVCYGNSCLFNVELFPFGQHIMASGCLHVFFPLLKIQFITLSQPQALARNQGGKCRLNMYRMYLSIVNPCWMLP